MKMWLPFDSRMYVSGIQRTDGSIAFEPKARAEVLRQHWQPVFDIKPVNEALARCLTKSLQPRMDPCAFSVPEEADYQEF